MAENEEYEGGNEPKDYQSAAMTTNFPDNQSLREDSDKVTLLHKRKSSEALTPEKHSSSPSMRTLLEEQVHQLQSTVNDLQPVQKELHEAKVKLALLESSLEEWKNTARMHGVENARALSYALDSTFIRQVDAFASSSQTDTQLVQLIQEVSTSKLDDDKATGKLNELLTAGKNQESLIRTLQKRLLLVTRERDSYIKQLGSYDKTLTVYGEADVGSTAVLSERVQQLEKDKAAHVKLVESLRVELNKWRVEAENLKCEAAELSSQRNILYDILEKTRHAVDQFGAAIFGHNNR